MDQVREGSWFVSVGERGKASSRSDKGPGRKKRGSRGVHHRSIDFVS